MLVVERQHGGAVGQEADAVPAHDWESPKYHRDNPASTDQQEGAEAVAAIVEFHLQHGDVSLNGNGQQAEHRSWQGNKHAAFSYKPLGGGEAIGFVSR